LPNLKAGGAERVISFLATKFYEHKQEVTLLVLVFEKDKVFETGSLTIVYLNRQRLLFSVFDTINFIKKTKSSIVLSNISHVNIFMSLISVFFKIQNLLQENLVCFQLGLIMEVIRQGC